MDVRFQPRDDAWRGRGRPPRQPSPKVLQLLRQTARSGDCVEIPIDGDTTADEIKELRADLRAAERVLGGRVHQQQADGAIRFYWVPERKAANG